MAIGSRQQQTGQGPRQQPGQMVQQTRAATQEYQPPQGPGTHSQERGVPWSLAAMGQGTKSQDQRGVQGQRLAATGQDRYGPSTHSQERGVQGRLAAMGQGTGRGNPRSGAGAQAFKRHGGMGQTNMLAQASPWMNQGQSQMPQYGGQQMGQQQNQIRESLGGIATGLAGRVGAFGQGNPNQQAQMLNQQAIDANGEDAVNDYYQKLMSSPGYQGGPPPAQQMAQTQEATFRGQMNQMQDQMPQYGGNQMGQMSNLMTGQGMGQAQGPLMGGSNLMTGQGMGQGQRQQMGQMANRMAGQGMGQGMGQGQMQQMGQMANLMTGMRKQ